MAHISRRFLRIEIRHPETSMTPNSTRVSSFFTFTAYGQSGLKISQILDNRMIIHGKIILRYDGSYFTKILKD